MSYCQQCGNKLNGERFCVNCGRENTQMQNVYNEAHNNAGGFNELCCPVCGNKDLQLVTSSNVYTEGKNFSGGKGCLGFLLLGPLGLLCGMCGENKEVKSNNEVYWICKCCGHQFEKNENIEVEEKMENQRLNTVLAVTSLIFGIISLFLFPILTGFLAIILGSAALCVKGRSSGTAIAGIVLGFISFAVFTIFLFVATH